ncbi:hypothetical protein H6G17_23120 [Chroococcidiopsis sp. FACHB-1243]|nr:hypothetical protein [Chroococcidiopsis sp. [FACHB-1243]]
MRVIAEVFDAVLPVGRRIRLHGGLSGFGIGFAVHCSSSNGIVEIDRSGDERAIASTRKGWKRSCLSPFSSGQRPTKSPTQDRTGNTSDRDRQQNIVKIKHHCRHLGLNLISFSTGFARLRSCTAKPARKGLKPKSSVSPRQWTLFLSARILFAQAWCNL